MKGVMGSLPGVRSRPGTTPAQLGGGSKAVLRLSSGRTARLNPTSATPSTSRWGTDVPLPTRFRVCRGPGSTMSFSAVADTTTFTAAHVEPPEHAPKNTTIVGGGPTGLATAIMLARMGYQSIQVHPLVLVTLPAHHPRNPLHLQPLSFCACPLQRPSSFGTACFLPSHKSSRPGTGRQGRGKGDAGTPGERIRRRCFCAEGNHDSHLTSMLSCNALTHRS